MGSLILGYSVEPNKITRFLYEGSRWVRVREEKVTKRSGDWSNARKGPKSTEYRQPLEAGKCKGTNSFLRPPEGPSPADILTLVQWD